MNNRKTIVNQNNDRKSKEQKLKEALAKKPTASYLNNNKISQDQLNQINLSEDKEKMFSTRLIRNAKKRRKTQPQKIYVESDNITYMESFGSIDGISHEFQTPDWFRTTNPVDVSVIIPLYKSEKVIKDLIRTWPLNNKLKVEIIFVDDNCPNQSRNTVLHSWTLRKSEIKNPIGKIIYNTNNKGYGQACNAGVNVATGKYLIFLNADTTVTPNWIDPIIELFDDPKVGLVGNLHLKEGGLHGTIDSAGSEWKWGDGSFVHIGRHSYKRNPLNAPYKPENAPKDLLAVSEREMVTGCCFGIKAELFNYIGGFNPNYKIGYWEDSEICLNVRELGYKVMYQPNSVIWHKLGHTSSGGHKYFGHNKQYFINKWIKSHRLDDLLFEGARPSSREPVEKIVVRRTNAHGDALVATGVCSALKEKYPKAKIVFASLYPEIICENKYIDEFIHVKNIGDVKHDVFYNLDYCYEWRPNVNIMTAYAEAVGVKVEDCKLHMNPQPIKLDLPSDYIVIHAGKTNWVGRDWPHENFVEIANRLLKNGEKVVAVGKYSEDEIPCTLDARSKTSIAEMAWIMSKAKAFIGIDSLPMHVAQAFDVPGISFFGCISPELRIYSKKMKGITANNLSCLGCHHRKAAPSTVTRICETNTLDCITKVSIDQMWQQITTLLKEIA